MELDIPRVPGGYGTILIDPPWPYGQKLTGANVRGGAEKHYETMTLEEISALPVRQLAARDAIVWLWTTNTHHHAAFHALECVNLRAAMPKYHDSSALRLR